MTPECCIKSFPTAFERCYGSLEAVPARHSLPVRAAAALTATAVAAQPLLIPAERRGTELAADMLRKLEDVLTQCAVRAEREVNGWALEGRSLDETLCMQPKGEGTWATYLGNRKHVAAWLCLREELPKLLPKDRFLLEPRFMLNPRTERWEYMDENLVSQIVSELGYKGLVGTIRPDLVILDARHIIILVYDFKFPCPGTNESRWDHYTEGRWEGHRQDVLYEEATKVKPLRITPIDGVIREYS